MSYRKRYTLAAIGALLLSACAPVAEKVEQPLVPTVSIEGFVISNELRYPVTDVMIEVPTTGAFAGCGNLMPQSRCSSSFELTDYQGNGVIISWKEYGQPHQTDEFVIKLPDSLLAGGTAWVEAIIFAPGQAGAKLVTTTP